MTFGEKVRLARKKHGWNQKDLADRMNTTRSTICRYETGAIRGVTVDVLINLAHALEVEAGWLVSDDDHAYEKICRDADEIALLSAWRLASEWHKEAIRQYMALNMRIKKWLHDNNS